MKKTKLLSFALLLIKMSIGQKAPLIHHQNSEYFVNVPVQWQNFDRASISIDGVERVLNKSDLTAFFPKVTGSKNVSIKLFNINSIGLKHNKTLAGSFEFIGSDKNEIILTNDGELSIKQWPKAEFDCKNNVEIRIDGVVEGTTFYSKTLDPNQDFKVEWVNGDKVICSTTVRLTYNQKKKYTCDGDTVKEGYLP